ncbi:ArsR/SmtB family transcription factor [Georgenia subflava]|uniref:Metalloregulator ArsR/SmtB family transcription factor n=1 Tax=Georgenia subflava TaxID=1622177 RepID=A0A6N7EPH0_9MICO|nr:metalloregulator ArsR/SmtB family transcription factor [Georgenia subflava]MPV38046.1 metalloregulator ArsR/SmtB family transcription factor [Georgenia subflava]
MTTLLPLVTTEEAGCCSPATEALAPDSARDAAAVFKALADPTRLRLLSLIAARAEGEACVCDLTDPVGLSQPTVSHHMTTLAKVGLVTREQRGKWAYFAVAPGARDLVQSTLGAVLGTDR